MRTNYPSDDCNVDYEKIKTSPYLEAFIKEVLRKHLIISKIFRKALVDCELGGLKLKKDTFISIPIYALHHYEKYWVSFELKLSFIMSTKSIHSIQSQIQINLIHHDSSIKNQYHSLIYRSEKDLECVLLDDWPN